MSLTTSEGNEEEMKNYSHLALGRLPKKEELMKSMDSTKSEGNGGKETLPSLPSLLLKKISEADSTTLKKVVDAVSPNNSSWNCQIFLDDLSGEAMDKLVELFEITPTQYCCSKTE